MVRLVVVALLLVSCGGGDKDTSPGVASSVAAEAGKVRELTGKVTATRGTDTRTLAVGGTVGAEDVIDTGADGSVVIELAHNNALWSLESGIKARVDQSVAWGLAKQEAAKPVEHATSSAGRHADREAADTKVTAKEAPNAAEQEAAKEEPRAPAAVAAPSPSTGAPKAPPPPPPRDNVVKDPPAPKPSAGCDEVGCIMNGDEACCAKYRKSGATAPRPEASGLPETPAAGEIRTAMNVVKTKIRACVEKSPAAKGTLKLAVKVAPDGKVVSVTVTPPVDPVFDRCVLAAARTLTLSRSQSGISFTYPITVN